jgi:integrase
VSEGSVFRRKDGKWCGKYKDLDGRYRYLYRRTKSEVRLALREAIQDRDDGIISVDNLTMGLLLDQKLENTRNTISYRTWINQESIIRLHVKPYLGSKKLSELSPEDVRVLYRIKLLELSSKTVKRIHTILNQVLREAVASKYLRSNPLDHVKPPKEFRSERKVLTPDQVGLLLDTVKGHRCEGVFVLGVSCALRIGEILALRWEDIDFSRGTLQVNRTLWRGNVYPPKTSSSRRTIRLPEIALEVLRRNQRDQGWVFPTSGNKPLAAHNFHKCYWKRTLREARLPDITFHQLRHTSASLLLNSGVPVIAVSKYLGHADSGVTMRTYAHLIEGMDGLAAEGMNQILS